MFTCEGSTLCFSKISSDAPLCVSVLSFTGFCSSVTTRRMKMKPISTSIHVALLVKEYQCLLIMWQNKKSAYTRLFCSGLSFWNHKYSFLTSCFFSTASCTCNPTGSSCLVGECGHFQEALPPAIFRSQGSAPKVVKLFKVSEKHQVKCLFN